MRLKKLVADLTVDKTILGLRSKATVAAHLKKP